MAKGKRYMGTSITKARDNWYPERAKNTLLQLLFSRRGS